MKFLSIVLVSCVLAACGGGGGGGGGSSGILNSGNTEANLTVSGTAATGKAIAGAIINAKCQLGTGTATTNSDGIYSLNITGGSLPCVLQIANPVDGTKLHTVATGSGNTAIANITPLTEMLVARALRNDPAVFFATFNPATAVNTMTAVNLKAAQVEIAAVLSGTVDISSLTDFIATTLKAATVSDLTKGDAHDKLLDALRAKLSPAQITQAVSALVKTSNTAEIKQFVANLSAVPPTANAGVDQSVVAGTIVSLDGSTSTVTSARTLTYTWTLTAKPVNSSASLSSPTSAKPTFTADVAGTYVASVVVHDGLVSSSTAAVSITASVANSAPVANSGVAQNIVARTTVTLDGSASSDANKDSLTYFWTLSAKPVGSTAVLSSSVSAKPTFTADVAGSYVATLVVHDGKVNSNTSTVSITAALANVAPVANAGVAQNVVAGMLVNLNGSASSDANGDTLTYAWTLNSKPVGSAAVVTGSTSALSTFTADVAGTYVASLIVNDGKLSSNVATMVVTAAVANVAPVANAGVDQNVTAGANHYFLDGSRSSDANGDTLTYQWTFLSVPVNSSLQPFYSGRDTIRPDILANVPGTYVISLVVSDGKVSSTPSTVTITAAAVNLNSPPNAAAGIAQNVMAGSFVSLDGSASSDANGDALTYSWTLTARPTGSSATLSSSSAAKPTFTADLAGSYVATLVVNDGKINSSASMVSITAAPHSLTLLGTSTSPCFFSCNDIALSFPYAMNSAASINSICIGNSCPTAYTVDAFKLRAVGKSYTITNLQARNLANGSVVTPFFSGLTNGQIIADGQTVTFNLQSPFTSRSIVNLNYSFTVLETGATFNYTTNLQTN